MNGHQNPRECLIEPDELKRIIKSSDNLILLPATVMEALELANDPECSIPAFVQLVETDTGLVTDILSMANSALYAGRTETKSVQQAVLAIGLRQCQNLIISSCVQALSRKLPPSVEWSRDVLWQHNVQTASIARYLNKQLHLGFEGEEFSGAMMHDVGRLLIAAAAPDVFEAVDRLSFCESADTVANERALIGTDHCEIGSEFVAEGGLPQLFVDVVRFHHFPDEAGENSKLVHLIAAADHMANHLMYAGGVDDYDFTMNPSMQSLVSEMGDNQDWNALSVAAMQVAEQATVESTSTKV